MRVGIFDACRSGVVNRTKGARKGPAFEVQADRRRTTRAAWCCSPRPAPTRTRRSPTPWRGSYFSHHLVSGLRGSADRSADRRVTLSEAYEYAYARTVADTADTAAGAQHPTFSYDLKGNGNLVLTELGLGREGLYLPGRRARRHLLPRRRRPRRGRRRGGEAGQRRIAARRAAAPAATR